MNLSDCINLVAQSANTLTVTSTVAGIVIGAVLTTGWYKTLPKDSKAKEIVDVVRDTVLALMEISNSVKTATGGKLPEDVAKNLRDSAVNTIGEKINGFTQDITRELVGTMVDNAVESLKVSK